MISKMFRIGTCSLIGLGGWIAGTVTERHKTTYGFSFIPSLGHEKHLPGLPIFGTVSAAAPIISNKEVAEDPFNPQEKLGPSGRVSEIMKFGFPSLSNLRTFDDYVLSYDTRARVAYWVFEHFTADRLKPKDQVNRSLCNFSEDESIHKYFRSTNADYKGSGFDRGHLAAAGNHRLSQKHVEQTFLLSNMAPQVGEGFNRGAWNQLERHVRKLTKTYSNVYVCTGPLYLPRKESDGKNYVKYQVIGANHVAVPTHFFKIVIMETYDDHLHMEAYVMPNKEIDERTPLFAFQVPPDTVERASGLLFFDRMNRSKLVQINGRKTTYV
ncbi:endonuclease G, mitochondrial [Lycorma delicatula]|uniref:endonuclease G, mitochondrial n=1 Tax=Lycorma delicatula TaxID=130591 RepID=UPI003F519278